MFLRSLLLQNRDTQAWNRNKIVLLQTSILQEKKRETMSFDLKLSVLSVANSLIQNKIRKIYSHLNHLIQKSALYLDFMRLYWPMEHCNRLFEYWWLGAVKEIENFNLQGCWESWKCLIKCDVPKNVLWVAQPFNL